MKKIIFIFYFSLSFYSVFSQATSGTRITAPVVPNDSSDVYPTHDAFFGRDGFRSVIDTIQRNNIPAGFRKEGMLIWCKSDSITYQLLGGTDNANWVQYSAGGSGTYHPYGGLSTLNLKADTLELNGDIIIKNDTVLFLPIQSLFKGSLFIGNGGRYMSHASSTQGYFNIGIGFNSGKKITTGFQNLFIGSNSGYNTTTGRYNNAIGDSALFKNTTGSNNIAIGAWSYFNNVNGLQGVAIGPYSLYSNTSGLHNIGIGYKAGYSNISTGDNVFIGYYAGLNGRFTNSVLIGRESGAQSTSMTGKGLNQIGLIKIGNQAGTLDTSNYRGYIEPSNSQTPALGMKFDEDKVGVNMLITSAWDSTFNVGGGIKARGGLFTNDIKANKLFTNSIEINSISITGLLVNNTGAFYGITVNNNSSDSEGIRVSNNSATQEGIKLLNYSTGTALTIGALGVGTPFKIIDSGSNVKASINKDGDIFANKYFISTLNTAPLSSTDTGTTGEMRITADYIYICTATNTWKRTAITTW